MKKPFFSRFHFIHLMWPTLDDSPKIKTLVGGWALEIINSHHVPTIASKTRLCILHATSTFNTWSHPIVNPICCININLITFYFIWLSNSRTMEYKWVCFKLVCPNSCRSIFNFLAITSGVAYQNMFKILNLLVININVKVITLLIKFIQLFFG